MKKNEYREFWLASMIKIVRPVFDSLEKAELKKKLPIKFHQDRAEFAPLEAFGRSMLGIAPWLEINSAALCEEERKLQSIYRQKVLTCIVNATNPQLQDYMLFDRGGQPLVDAAFLAHSLVRAPKEITAKLNAGERRFVADAFRSSRNIIPCNSNWLFFSAMVEAGLYVLGEKYDIVRVLYALRTFNEWYKGDGIYGDGEKFHWDYYNSFVIQPMYIDLIKLFKNEYSEIAEMEAVVLSRASRYASVLERMIGPDGSFPVVGRSVCYRFGAFQLLSQAVLEGFLEKSIAPSAVRCGLTAVISKVMSYKDMFDENGWLLPGICGHQPELAEGYINIGSLYLCSSVFLPLGLDSTSSFWSDDDEDWSGRKIWSGGHSKIDHAIN